MKKRLRKKRRVGEYQELGFEVAFRLLSTLSEEQVLKFWDQFITDAIEASGLMCGGRCGHEWDVFVTRPSRASATEEDRDRLRRWLEENLLVSDIRIGPLGDSWHSA